MYRRKGFALAMEWSYRRRCGIFGRNWYSIDYKLEEFVPFSSVFEARQREMSMKTGRSFVGELVRSFIFEFELYIAENPQEEKELEELGSLVVFTRPRFGKWKEWWKVIAGGRNFLDTFKPYRSHLMAIRALTRERSRGREARLASWRMNKLTSDKRITPEFTGLRLM